MLDAGMLDAGFCNTGCLMLYWKPRFWMLDGGLNSGRGTEFWTRYWMLAAVQDAAMPDAAILDAAVQDAGC